MKIINKINKQALESVRLYGMYTTRVYVYKRRIISTIYGKIEVIRRIYRTNWRMRSNSEYWEIVYCDYIGGNGYESD